MKALPSSCRVRRWLARACLGGALALCLGALGLWLAVVAEDYPRARLDVHDASSLTLRSVTGEPLWQRATDAGGKGQWTPLSRISPRLIDAVLAGEDHRFHAHVGVDPIGVVRAVYLNLRGMRVAFGGSTLSMQLVRVLDPSIGRDLLGKLRQVVLALRLERAASKREILEQYLNRVYFGHGAWGVGVAARTFFDKAPSELSLSEAALLAALPRSPSGYSPFRHRERAIERRDHLLSLMVQRGDIRAADRELARRVPLSLRGRDPQRHAPHFVDHLLLQLPADAPELAGAQVHTTLDLGLQQALQVAVRRHLDAIGGQHVQQAGVVVVRHRDGAILAMVGSRDYFDAEADGAHNATTTRLRPGSTLKPFVYALALEAGDSPATLAFDIALPGEQGQGYTADVRQHGPARYRESLAGSYNLAAVHTLQRVGVPALVRRLRKAGVSALDAPIERYGPSLAIGEAQFTLLQYVGAFAAFGNRGRAVRPRAVTRIDGLLDASACAAPGCTQGRRPAGAAGVSHRETAVFSEAIAYQVFDMLSDPDARRPMFGDIAPMALPFDVALKTGTTRAYTDNLAFGTTAEYTVGAWAGNFDGTPTHTVMAMQGAAPLVRAAFVALAARYGPPTAPPRPAALFEEEVCPLSGKRPGPDCPHRKLELFSARSRLPLDDRCQMHVRRCGVPTLRFPPEATHWARRYGLLLPDPCADRGGAVLATRIVYPVDGARFRLDPFRDARHQRPPLRALPADDQTRFAIDGVPVDDFVPTPGTHVVRATRGASEHEVRIHFQ